MSRFTLSLTLCTEQAESEHRADIAEIQAKLHENELYQQAQQQRALQAQEELLRAGEAQAVRALKLQQELQLAESKSHQLAEKLLAEKQRAEDFVVQQRLAVEHEAAERLHAQKDGRRTGRTFARGTTCQGSART